MQAPGCGGGYGPFAIVVALTCIAPLFFASRALGADAGSFTPEQQTLYAKCEKSPPASQVQDCTSVID